MPGHFLKHHSLYVFSKREALLLVLSSMFMVFFLSLSLQGAVEGLDASTTWSNLFVLLGEVLLIVPAYLILKQRSLHVLQTIPRYPASPLTFLMASLLVIGLLGVMTLFEVLIIPIFPVPEFLSQLGTEIENATPLNTIILMLAAVGVAPFVEEALFRGILQHSLYFHYGARFPAIIIPSLAFTLFHPGYLFYFPAMIELLTLALLLAWIMSKTGNLWVVALVHGLFNLSTFISVFTIDLDAVPGLDELNFLWIGLSGLMLWSAIWYFRQLKPVAFEQVYLVPIPENTAW